MTPVDEIVARLRSDFPELRAAAIADAASFFEESGDVVTTADAQQLKSALIEIVAGGAQNDETGAALWALGKLHDVSLKPIFQNALRASLEGDANILWQAMCSLDLLGENVLRGGGSLRDENANREKARSYLARMGPIK